MKHNTFKFNIDEAVEKYADTVYRLALQNTNTECEADDIFQEVFLKLYKNKDKIQSDEHLKAWLIRVTINQCKSYASKIWNKKRVSLSSIKDIYYDTKIEDYSQVYEAVKILPQKYRDVIYLYYYEEFKIKEIAKILNKNEATIKTHLSRGKKFLKKILKGGFEDGTL